MPKWPGLRVIQDPPMAFPLRGEICRSFFIVTPWGMWIEFSQWSESGPKAQVLKALRESSSSGSSNSSASGSGSGSSGGDTSASTVAKAGSEYDKYMRAPVESLPTPSLIVDLDALDHNLRLICQRTKAVGVSWRPPIKAHRCPDLAKLYVDAGAEGVLCLTLLELRAFAAHGFTDLHLANTPVDEETITGVALIARRHGVKRVRVNVDALGPLQLMAKVAKQWEAKLDVLVEVNVNHNRCGATVAEAVDLAKAIVDLQGRISKDGGGVRFAGITGYEGHTPILPPEDKTRETFASHRILAEVRAGIEKAGIAVPVVTGGGSCNYIDALKTGVLTELQSSGGGLDDHLYHVKAGLQTHGHTPAAFVLSRVISAGSDGLRATGDAGFKALGWHPFGGLPAVWGNPNVEVIGLSAEHTKLKPKAAEFCPKRGDKVMLIPGYMDAAGYAHRVIFAARKGVVEQVWPTTSDKAWV